VPHATAWPAERAWPEDGDTFVLGLAGADGIPTFWLSRAMGSETRELHVAFRAADREAITSRLCTTGAS
jgi:hypothetical protein